MSNKDIEKFFNDNASIYFANKYFLKKRSDFIKNFTSESNRILEVGIGTGDLAKHYSNGFVTGCDISQKMIDRAQIVLPESILKVCDAEDLQYDSASFDILVASEIIYYLANPQNFLNEANRVLKSGGKLILIWGNINFNFIYKIASTLKLRAEDPFALQTISRDSLSKLISGIYFNSTIKYYGIGLPSFLSRSENYYIMNTSPIIGLVIHKI